MYFSNVSYVKNGDMYSSDTGLVVPALDKMLKLEIISNKNDTSRARRRLIRSCPQSEGAPVSGAEVSLGVVDEAIYSVAPDYAGNIKSEFYGMRYNSVETHLSISYSHRFCRRQANGSWRKTSLRISLPISRVKANWSNR